MNETDMLQGTNFNNLNQNGFNQLLAGDNPVVSDSTEDSDENDSTFKASFLDWLSSVSGANFWKNVFSTNHADNFWDFIYKDPDTGFSVWDFYKNGVNNAFNSSRIGKAVNQVTGDLSNTFDDNIFNDIPSNLADIFKQGLDMFRRNSENQQTYNAEQAEAEREWAKMMRRTYYQDVMYSLKEAGINPLLAFDSLGSVSTPSGASASSSLANSNSLFSSMAQSVLGDEKLTMSLITALLGIFRIFTGKYSLNK